MFSPPTRLADRPTCDVSRFSCGDLGLDEWLKTRARAAEGRTARSYVVCLGERVIAYYCLSAGSLQRAHLPKRIRHGNPDPVPVLVLGRLAVDREFQHRRIGPSLAADCFRRCVSGAAIIGARGVVVHPLGQRTDLVEFYQKLGFERLPDAPHAMFVRIESIASD